MTRKLVASGSPFEAEIGYSRAVVDGEWIFVPGTTGFDYRTMTIPTEPRHSASRRCATSRRPWPTRAPSWPKSSGSATSCPMLRISVLLARAAPLARHHPPCCHHAGRRADGPTDADRDRGRRPRRLARPADAAGRVRRPAAASLRLPQLRPLRQPLAAPATRVRRLVARDCWSPGSSYCRSWLPAAAAVRPGRACIVGRAGAERRQPATTPRLLRRRASPRRAAAQRLTARPRHLRTSPATHGVHAPCLGTMASRSLPCRRAAWRSKTDASLHTQARRKLGGRRHGLAADGGWFARDGSCDRLSLASPAAGSLLAQGRPGAGGDRRSAEPARDPQQGRAC